MEDFLDDPKVQSDFKLVIASGAQVKNDREQMAKIKANTPLREASATKAKEIPEVVLISSPRQTHEKRPSERLFNSENK